MDTNEKVALTLIAKEGCDRFTAISGETCRSQPDLKRDAEYGSERWCDACIAAWGLDPRAVTQAEFFSDKAHGVKMIRIAVRIISRGLPMSGKSVHEVMAELNIDDLQERNEREIFGIVGHLRQVGGA